MKYYITWDLEKTVPLNTDNIYKVDEYIRKELIDTINNSFGEKITKFIPYYEIKWFFEEKANPDEFIISLDDGIYSNPDFNFSSTRMYKDKNSILNNPKNYKILQRNWKNLNEQLPKLKSIMKESWKNKVVLVDDGIFSWDTLNDILNILKKNNVKIDEIRVALNFSWNDSINWIKITSMFKGNCIEWIDERDFFYGTKNWWASFFNTKWKINWLPYISSSEIASKKASIPEYNSKKFCEKMIWVNIDLYQETWKKFKLEDIKRLSYLEEIYNPQIELVELLKMEQKNLS